MKAVGKLKWLKQAISIYHMGSMMIYGKLMILNIVTIDSLCVSYEVTQIVIKKIGSDCLAAQQTQLIYHPTPSCSKLSE